MNLAPIALFVYDRLEYTKQSIHALQNNLMASDSELFIFSDGPQKHNEDDVAQVRKYIHTISGFKNIKVIEAENNMGLANSIISGGDYLFKIYNEAVFLEDDLITSKYFLHYINNALSFYNNIKNVYSISSYNLPKQLMNFPPNFPHDVYFNYRNSSWGWGTWKDRWNLMDWDLEDYTLFKNDKHARKHFNRGGWDLSRMLNAQMDGKIDSWAIRWYYNQFKNNGVTLYPVHSYVKNIGVDNTGTHGGIRSKQLDNIQFAKKDVAFLKDTTVNSNLMRKYRFALIRMHFFTDVFKKLLRELKHHSLIL